MWSRTVCVSVVLMFAALFLFGGAHGQGLPSFSVSDANVAEGNSGFTILTFTITKSGTSMSGSTVHINTVDNTAFTGSDYESTVGEIQFAANVTSINIDVYIRGDIRLEPDETLFLSLSNPTNATISRAQGVGTILNDDTLRQSPVFDFDGDTITDISIYRPGPSEWWIYLRRTSSVFATQLGSSGDVIAPADFTGDNKTDVAFFRPSTGFWYILRSEDFSYYAFPFGQLGDIPMPADYDGDGNADPGIFRPSSGVWYVLRSSDSGVTIDQFGEAGDQPISADYDGDGMADFAVFRRNGPLGEWWIKRSTAGVFAATFGTANDKTVQGDWTGDAKADCAFYRPSTAEWFVLRSEDGSYYSWGWGTPPNDIPVPGDWHGDGRMHAGVFRPSITTWFTDNYTVLQFGSVGDQMIPDAYLR